MELAFGRPLFDRFAHGNANLPGGYEAGLAALLEDAVDVMRRRADRLMGVTRLHTPTTDEPLIVLLVDEIAALTAWINDRTMKTADRLRPVAAARRGPRRRRRRRRRRAGPPQGRHPATRPVPDPDRAPGQRSRTRPPRPGHRRPQPRRELRTDPRHPARRRLRRPRRHPRTRSGSGSPGTPTTPSPSWSPRPPRSSRSTCPRQPRPDHARGAVVGRRRSKAQVAERLAGPTWAAG